MNRNLNSRLFLTWSSLDSVRSNKCAQDKRNEFVVGFEKVVVVIFIIRLKKIIKIMFCELIMIMIIFCKKTNTDCN